MNTLSIGTRVVLTEVHRSGETGTIVEVGSSGFYLVELDYSTAGGITREWFHKRAFANLVHPGMVIAKVK